jgi:Transposase DDE domain
MSHSTLTISDYQYLDAFRQLFTPQRLKDAVAVRRQSTRDRILPLWILLGLLVTWFWLPADKLPFLLRWFRPSRKKLPTDPAVYQARGRLGWAPLRWLRKHVLGTLANPELDPSAFHHGHRLLGLDGTTFTVADTPANAHAFGRANNQHHPSGYPVIRMVAVCELGTHALIDWIARGYHKSEVELARRLLRRVPAGSLLLVDRNFHSFDLWHAARTGQFDLLIRVQKGPTFPVQKVLDDGSYLSRVLPRRGPNKAARAIEVRVIRYRWTDAAGQVHESRVVTSLLDAVTEPASELVALYHRRWEEELALGEVKEQLALRVTHVRAHDPVRALAELDGLLMGHWVLRWVILQASRAAGVTPVAISFVGALRVLKARLGVLVGRGGWKSWWSAVLREIGGERLRTRRNRQCPRVRKTTRSHWPTKKNTHKEGTIPVLRVVPSSET